MGKVAIFTGEFLKDGHLSIPEKVIKTLSLKKGSKVKMGSGLRYCINSFTKNWGQVLLFDLNLKTGSGLRYCIIKIRKIGQTAFHPPL